MKKPVAIVGAGLAGLAAAAALKKSGVPYILFEAGKRIAGLAQSFQSDDGFTYDFGAHFITNRLADFVGIGDRCRTVHYYGESVWLDGRVFSYPFGLLRVPRFLRSAIATRSRDLLRGTEPQTCADWFRGKYGRALADEIALPLVEAWSGVPSDQLAPSVGESIPSSIAHTIMLRAAARLKKKAVACGYSRELPEKPSVWHVYPEGGMGVLCDRLAEGTNGSIRMESPVEEIIVSANRVVGVKSNGRVEEVAGVLSTAPCQLLAKLVKGTDALDYLNRFQYRPMVFVNLRFDRRHLLPDVVLWTPERRFPFFRLTETTLSMPWLAPEGKSLVTVDMGCQIGDEIWNMDEAEAGEFVLEHLKPIIPDARRLYLGCRMLKTPFSYPVYLSEYEDDRRRFERSTGVEGLTSIGRNGEFSHMFMEDVYVRATRKAEQLAVSLG